MHNKEINNLSHREAMGLPDTFVSSLTDESMSLFNQLRCLSTEELVFKLESKETSLLTKITAGNILALVGDPRISVFNPSMVSIPAGTFQVGTEVEKIESLIKEFKEIGVQPDWLKKETPSHSVDLSSFEIAVFPVTNFEYRQFLLDSDYNELPSSWLNGVYPIEKSNHPVYSVSMTGVKKYIAWLNVKAGKNYRLPTEPEWEVAARGDRNTQYPWGDTFCSEKANTLESGIFNTTPVGCFPTGRSYFKALDMAGDVEEYTATKAGPYKGGPDIKDDLLLELGEYNIARGGSFAKFRDLARAARRHGPYPGPLYAMGFRLAHSI